MIDPSGINQELNKENFDLKQRIKELEQSESDLRRAEAALKASNSDLAVLNSTAIELASIHAGQDLYAYIATKLKKITNAAAATFGVYDIQKREIQVKGVELEKNVITDLIQSLGGKELTDVSFPVTEDARGDIIQNPVRFQVRLSEITFGVVSQMVAKIVQKSQSIDRFVGIGYVVDAELYGTSVLGLRSDLPDPSLEMLQSFSNLVAVSLMRTKSEIQLKDTLESLRKAVGTTIQVMATAVETRDPYTAGHQTRSADVARAIAVEMGLQHDKIDAIRMAGSIHDIGKLSIPAEILSKPTKLSDIEFRLIKEHAKKGYEMLKNVESPWPLAEIVYQHHERVDGSGYPRNLKGEDICIEARILAVADVVEAMASHRPYRPSLGIDAALSEIEKNRGIFYDNAIVDACLRLFREKGFQLAGT